MAMEASAQAGASDPKRKVVFCIPTVERPFSPMLEALAASVPAIQAAGWDEGCVSEIGNPYISAARNIMLRKALDAKADVVVFLDHDLSWQPLDLLSLIETGGDVVAGTYRFKHEPEKYMGKLAVVPGTMRPIQRGDGCIKATSIPAGFLKITRNTVNSFIEAYPELCYGEKCSPHVDLFNHGAMDGIWYGEDYGFSYRWTKAGGELWIRPDLDISHHLPDGQAFPGNFLDYMLRQPGGSKAGQPMRQPSGKVLP